MLPDLSGSHILIVLVVALIVVGPKDLPALLRRIGQFVGKMRSMANEFRSSFDEMARQSELDDLRKEVEAMRKASQAALPQDLGIAAQMQSDSEAAYLANWEASHAPSTDSGPVMTALDKPAEAAEPVQAAKPRAKRAAVKKSAEAGETVAEAAPRPRARKTAAKTPPKTAKPEADA